MSYGDRQTDISSVVLVYKLPLPSAMLASALSALPSMPKLLALALMAKSLALTLALHHAALVLALPSKTLALNQAPRPWVARPCHPRPCSCHPGPWPGADLRWGRVHLPPIFTCCLPQIQKLADRADVISEVPKCSKIQIFWGSAPDPSGELTALLQAP